MRDAKNSINIRGINLLSGEVFEVKYWSKLLKALKPQVLIFNECLTSISYLILVLIEFMWKLQKLGLKITFEKLLELSENSGKTKWKTEKFPFLILLIHFKHKQKQLFCIFPTFPNIFCKQGKIHHAAWEKVFFLLIIEQGKTQTFVEQIM